VIIRTHRSADSLSEVAYSPCETYRYTLTRQWDATAPRLLFVMLNPSTASETRNDPTLARCEARARAMGQGAFRVANLFAFRATDPLALRRATDPVGAENDRVLTDSALWADAVICAWGNHGALLGRSATVGALLRSAGQPMLHLGLTGAGQPRHPLYVRNDVGPQPWLAS
jgi:hypothetical protein